MDIDYNRFMDYDPKVQAHIRKRVNEIIAANQAAIEAMNPIVIKATSEAKTEKVLVYIAYDWFIDDNPDVQAHIEKRVNEIIVANQAAFEAIAKIVVKATSEAKAKAEAEARAKAEAEAETKARLQSLQKVAYKVISNCFPSLTSLAQEQVALIDNPEYLDDLIDQLLALPNEATMRKELHLPPLLRCQSS